MFQQTNIKNLNSKATKTFINSFDLLEKTLWKDLSQLTDQSKDHKLPIHKLSKPPFLRNPSLNGTTIWTRTRIRSLGLNSYRRNCRSSLRMSRLPRRSCRPSMNNSNMGRFPKSINLIHKKEWKSSWQMKLLLLIKTWRKNMKIEAILPWH